LVVNKPDPRAYISRHRENKRQRMSSIHDQDRKKSYAMVCAANMNRSMAAHFQLLQNNFKVKSFGAGSSVKIPGQSKDDPNVYAFNEASYEEILSDLKGLDG
jgi:hypothetical protein